MTELIRQNIYLSAGLSLNIYPKYPHYYEKIDVINQCNESTAFVIVIPNIRFHGYYL